MNINTPLFNAIQSNNLNLINNNQVNLEVLNIVITILKKLNVNSVETFPNKNDLLYIENSYGSLSLHLPLDFAIGRNTLASKNYNIKNQNFIYELVKKKTNKEYTLVDIGSNIGLFSRQCLKISNFKEIYCYEPQPFNFNLLIRNLHNFPNVFLHNYGLSDCECTLPIYIDKLNCGNSSLNLSAMSNGYSQINVKIKNVNEEKNKWLTNKRPIFYKSDTQGLDEKIATSIDIDFWDNVECGIFELWNIPDKNFNKDRFVEILEKFNNKVLGYNINENLSTNSILDFMSLKNRAYTDLFFWKD